MGYLVSVGTACAAVLGLACAAGAEEPATGSPWSFDVAALAWQRSAPDAGTIVAANPAGTPFLSGGDLDFGLGTGLEATLSYQAFPATSVEARLLYAKTDGSNTFVAPGGFIGVGFTGPGGTTFTSEFETRLSGGELNLRHGYSDRFSVLAGLRKLSVDDRLRTVLNANVATGLYEAENDLTGLQIGAQVTLGAPSDRWSVLGVGKLGAFRTKSSAGITEFAGVNEIGGFSRQDSRTAYAAELGLTAEYRLSERAKLTFGYQVLWLNDMAQATTAASESLLNPALLSGTVFRDDLSFQAVTLGFSMTF